MALLLNAGDAVSRSYSYTQPSPLHPIYPQETGERTGNLWDNSSTISKGESPSYYTANFGTPLPAGTYTFSAKVIGEEGVTACRVSFRKSNMGQIVASNIDVSPERTSITVTLNEPCYAVYMYGSNDTTTLAAVTYQDIMLNSGSTALPYEPYGYKIPISSGGVTTPVYLSEPLRKIGEYADVKSMTEEYRPIRKLVLTGDESWTAYASISDCYRLSIQDYPGITGNGLCSHYTKVATTSLLTNGTFVSGQNYSYFKDTSAQDLSGWKAYLAQQYTNGTPVTIWYVLATPTTETISAPTIPTTAGEQTFDVDTSLKPSSVEITYKGWHKHTPKEYDNGSWS